VKAIKAQLNSGCGASFPMHSDSDSDVDSRQISCIIYLNQNWKKTDGGELRLYPFPYNHVDIEPVNDRMVLFSSGNMLHRVLPFLGESRYCFTIWFSGSGQRNVDIKPIHNKNNMWSLPLSARYRKHVARIIYAQEWADSLSQSHPPSPELQQALDQHWKSVKTISHVFRDFVPLFHEYLPIRENSPVPPGYSQDVVDWF